MKAAHKGMKITDAEFDALAADLKTALEKNGAKPDDVKAVLARSARRAKDIVEKDEAVIDPPDTKDKGDVTGKVAFKGEPVVDGKILLVPEKGEPISGKIDAQGKFKFANVPVGNYKVVIDAKPVPEEFGDARLRRSNSTSRRAPTPPTSI